MQLDSHSVLIEGWDVAAVDMWNRCPHEKCVLSHYPLVDGSSTGVPVICNVTNMESHGLPAFQAIIYGLQQGQFMPTPIAGGLGREHVAQLRVGPAQSPGHYLRTAAGHKPIASGLGT